MAKDKYYGKTLRKNFARHEEIMPMPNLLEIQKNSYQWFLDTGLRRRRPGRKNAKKPLTTIEQNGKIKCLCLQKMGTLHPTLIGSIAVSHRKGNRNLR